MSVGARLTRSSSLPGRTVVAGLAAVCALEALSLWAYLRASPGGVTELRYLLYPFVWLNVAGLVLVRTDVAPAPRRRQVLAAVVAVAYLAVLAAVDGTVSLASGTGLAVFWDLPPGWGPLVVAEVGPIRIAPVPYRTLGYVAIAYLLYAALVETSSRALGGLLGLFSCVSCTLPVVAAVLSGIVGGSAVVAATAWSHDLSTAVFLVTVAALAWQTGGPSGCCVG